MVTGDQSTPAAQEPRIAASIFEGLFVRGMTADATLKAKLKDAGLDLDHLQTDYPTEVMDRCMDLAALHLYPSLSREAAYRQLGARFVEGFRHTLLGSVVMAVFPLLGPDRLLARLAKSHGIAGAFGKTKLVPLEPKHYRFEYRSPAPPRGPQHEFTAGVFETLLSVTRVQPRVDGTPADGGFDLDIRW